MVKSAIRSIPAVLLALVMSPVVGAEQTGLRSLQALPVDMPPLIDGNGDDPVWRKARSITTRDAVADIPLTLAAVYTGQQVYFRISFPDQAPDLKQKAYIWDAEAGRYRTGPEREDTLVLKWAMDTDVTDLTISADESYKADIWYWKAARTDPVGYADDKLQIYSRGRLPQSKQLLSRGGQSFYLRRSGDTGKAAYEVLSHPEFQADSMPKYTLSKPTGSRADIRAKGMWNEGIWTLELARALRTDHPDDVQFILGQSHLFGVSRYEIAGRKPNLALQQPLFGAGEVGEHLLLTFLPAP